MSKRQPASLCVWACFLSLFLAMAFGSPAEAAKRAASSRVPELAERYSLIQSAEVSGDRGKNVPETERLNRAVSEARKAALRRAQQFLERKFRGVGFGYEILRTAPEGAVRVLDRRTLGPDEAGRPRWRIDMEVDYTFRPASGSDAASRQAAIDRAGLLNVRLWTDKKQYRAGEPVTVNFEGNRDFYAKLVRITAGGAIEQILPNNYRQLSSFRKGIRYQAPGEGDRFVLSPPPGSRETFLIVASPYAMSHINMKTLAGGIYQYRSRWSSFERAVRSGLTLGAEDVAEFFTAGCEIEVSLP